jgi:hypothetical protein
VTGRNCEIARYTMFVLLHIGNSRKGKFEVEVERKGKERKEVGGGKVV